MTNHPYQGPPDAPSGSRYDTIRGMDPAAEWLLEFALDRFQPDGPEAPFPFFMRVDDQSGVDFLNERLDGEQPFYVASLAPGRRERIRPGEALTVFAAKTFFDQLARQDGPFEPLRLAAKEIEFSLPMRRSARSLPWSPRQAPPPLAPPDASPNLGTWPCDTVVIGIIDDGIAFAHERFRTAAGRTRIEYFWHQDGVPASSPTVPYGREWSKAGIDALLGAASPPDEDAIYRAAGLLDASRGLHMPIGRRAAHGTHVLDVATGADPARAPPNRPIVAVQLPVAATADASGTDIRCYVERAVDFICRRARLLAGGGRPLPVVINLSYALHHGPRDGTWWLERLFDGAIGCDDPPLRVVLPAGNGNAARCHAEFRFDPQQVVDLPWRVQPDDLTTTFMDVWLPHAGNAPPPQDRVRLSVATPAGVFSTPLGESDGARVFLESRGEVVGSARYSFRPFPTARGMFRIFLRPTALLAPSGPVAPQGLWTVRLENLRLTATDTVRAWIARDDLIFGYPRRGRQSYFNAGCYRRFDPRGRDIEDDPTGPACRVRRAGMLNGIGTGKASIVVGGFDRKALRLGAYSAGGPITPTRGGSLDPCERKPDAVAVSDDTRVHSGILAAGPRSGAKVALSGTSVAAPRLTRWIADRLGAGAPSGRDAVRGLAEADEATLPPGSPDLPPDRAGWGRITSLAPATGRGRRYWP